MTNNKIIFWASDYSSKSGEGKLAKLFISKLKIYKKNTKIIPIKSLFTKKNNNLKKAFFTTRLHKYVGPIYGIIYLWYFFLKGYRPCYLNYCPLWNFIVFLFLPPTTILGPITGSALKDTKFFAKNLFEQISIMIIKVRYQNIIFSNNFYRNTFKKSYHNFILLDFSIKKMNNNKKKYDFIFYIRSEFYKKNVFLQSLINDLLKLNFTIATIGDKIKLDKVINFGHCDKNKVNKIISLSEYAIGNKENLYSFFTQDCLKHNLIVFYNIDFLNYELFKFNNFYPIVYNNQRLALKQILKKIKIKKKSNHFKKINFDNYFKDLL